MFEFRPFKNADPPTLAEVWRSQPPLRALMQPMSSRLFEICVFSKQYFDPEGFLVATRDGAPVGFLHAGFGPNASGDKISTDTGVITMAMLHADVREPSLADELLRRGEEYLTANGAGRIFGGGRQATSQFYVGLYGGAELPGILASDTWQSELFTRNGYRPTNEVRVMQRDLVSFRPPISRDGRRLRREVNLQVESGVMPETWWEASEHSEQDLVRFEMVHRGDGSVWAGVSCWDIEPLATGWGVPTVGLLKLATIPTQRRRGLATFLLAETFRELRVRGVSMVEAHIDAGDEAAAALCKKLGFTQIDTGHVFERVAD